MRLIDLLLSDNPRELMESELLTSLPLPADDLVPDKQLPTGGLSDQLATLGELLLADPSVPVSRTSDSVSSTIANLLKSESLCSVTSSDYVPDRSGADCGSFTLEQLLRNDNSWSNISPVKHLSEPKPNGGVPSTLAQLLQSNSKLNSYVNTSSQSQATVPPSPVKQASCRDKCQMTDVHHNQLMQDEDLRISASCDLFGSQQVHLNTNFGVTLTDDEIDIEGFSLLSNEDAMGLFGEGIEAQDVASLLEQFEEAECSLPASPQIPSHHDPVPDSPPMTVPDAVSTTPTVPSTQSPLLSAPSSSSYLQSHLSSVADTVTTSLSNCVSVPQSPTMSLASSNRDHSHQNTSPLRCRSTSLQQSRSLLDSDSEVVKLLKAKHPAVTSLNKSVKPPVAAPSPEVIRKIKASNKRKSAIMLTNAVPTKAERGQAVEIPNFTSKKLQKIMRQGEKLAQALEGASTPSIDGSLSTASTPQASNQTTPACSDSEASRSSTPERRVKKITLLQYKTRREQMKRDPNYIEVNKSFYESIIDHDYCRNVPRAVSNVKASQQVWGKKYHEEGAENADSESVLKSLLLNQNLTEEMKKQAVKDREFTMKNMSRNASTSRQRRETITEVIDMDIDSDGGDEPTQISPSKTKKTDSSSCPRPNSKTTRLPNHCSRTSRDRQVTVNKPNFKTKRHYRTRSSCPNGDGESNVYFDKLPPYYTTLAVERANGALKKSNSSAQLMDTTLPDRDRDPSPEGDAVCDKVPDYYSCFTNSTKYDQQSEDPLCINNKSNQRKTAWEMSRSNSGSNYSSVSAMDIRSRSCSRSSSSSSSSRSRSRGRNGRRNRPGRRRSSGSSSSSRSPSRGKSYSRSRSRSYSRSHTRHFRRRCNRSYSRSDSESTSGSSSSRSRSRTSRSRDRHMRSKRTRRSHSRSWCKWKQEQHKNHEKKQQIDERRIVYVGGIPPGFTRRDLRKKFERFGDIEEVSVHFRDHGGDNYGFVTFSYACDAFSAIEKGKTLSDCKKFDLCFGGRREFCKADYADLDGNMEDEEEMGPVLPRRTEEVDFDELLRQAQKTVKKKSEPQRQS